MTSHERHGVSSHRYIDCLFNSCFGTTYKNHQSYVRYIDCLFNSCFGITYKNHQSFVLLTLCDRNPPMNSSFQLNDYFLIPIAKWCQLVIDPLFINCTYVVWIPGNWRVYKIYTRRFVMYVLFQISMTRIDIVLCVTRIALMEKYKCPK